MPKINVLDSRVYNRISAGEVVERPSSVVKELVENALDAGATKITIRIENGGIKLISITDNGCGIEFEDLRKAFLPHATSKISSADDLEAIATLGFRGEALASIGAVSRAEIISKVRDSDYAGRVENDGGKISESVICGAPDGTTINVHNLFYNTPARLKFLKSPKQEEGLVTNIISRLIFANPSVEFKYYVEDRLVYNSVSTGVQEKIFTIYGKETAKNMVHIEQENAICHLSGFLSLPTACKANRTYQSLIVNGRYVNNALISTAVSNAYANFLMKGKFPLYVLYLTIPYEDIDVNVHPSKMEIRFKDSKGVYNFVYYAVLQTLQENNFSVDGFVDNQPKFEEKAIEAKEPNEEVVSGGFSFSMLQKFADDMSVISVDAPVTYEESERKLASDDGREVSEYVLDKDFVESDLNKILSKKIGDNSPINESQPPKTLQEKENIAFDQQVISQDIPYNVLGTLFNTYILLESGDNFLLLDQHAGHERVLFDKFMKLFEERKLISQPLLIPYAFTVNEIEENLLVDNLHTLADMGFEVENFGHNTYRIMAVPSILSDIDLHEFVMESLSNVNMISSTNEQINNHFATSACKAAVKGGMTLASEEISILLKQIFQNNTRLQCPHGRPICVKFTKYEVEKMFKRVVT